jgi:beta-mannosidase
MQALTLHGTWQLEGPDVGIRCKASVPGCVHTALLAAGHIDDPYYRDNERRVRWVGENPWVYRRSFEAPAELTACDRLLLRCEGLDTLAALELNGQHVGSADNMYRTFEYDVRHLVRRGKNDLAIRFDSVIPLIEQRYRERPVEQWCDKDPDRVPHFAYVRKPGYQFGWDWSPALLTAGIWKPIALVGVRTARLSEVEILQQHKANGTVELSISCMAERVKHGELRVRVRLLFRGRVLDEAVKKLSGTKASVRFSVPDPGLWWPNGYGAQPLYTIDVSLEDSDNTVLDHTVRRIGLRDLRLVQRRDSFGTSFEFRVNGVPVWAKGGNWVPADSLPSRITREKLDATIRELKGQHVNMLRVWGGGFYESDDFYDACDEHGILVWQDFMFACSAYPAFDHAFMENVRLEAKDNILRIRHHPSLCLFCGNNELEEGLVGSVPKTLMSVKDYNRLFDELLPSLVKEHSSATPYTRCSGHTPGERRDRDHSFDLSAGDSHLWWVVRNLAQTVRGMDEAALARMPEEERRRKKWDLVYQVLYGLDRFDLRKVVPRFCSEYGRQSFPVMETLRDFAAPEDMNPSSPVMECHQRGSNTWLLQELVRRYRFPMSFESVVVLSQIEQGEVFRALVENWRSQRPRCMGALHWTANDCWPSVEWGTFDYHLRRKASYYIFKRFFQPVLVTGFDAPDKRSVEAFAVNDTHAPIAGTLRALLTDTYGKTVRKWEQAVSVAPHSSSGPFALDLEDSVTKLGAPRSLLWLELHAGRKLLAENLVLFAEPRQLELHRPKLALKKAEKRGRSVFTLKTDCPALWVWLEDRQGHVDLDNSFLPMRPGRSYQVAAEHAQRPKGVRARHLLDLYAPAKE